ncbi:hypothetical protein [Saccharicrinis sp. FJH54]|uniref:hypothetical protein n=1 Tax=Saccharicrinis sp. FJH54 TaxID=3344665 RepID=UPI0035D4D092
MAEDTRSLLERTSDSFQTELEKQKIAAQIAAEQNKITEEIILLLSKGFSIQEILAKDYSVGDLREAGISTDELINTGVDSTDIITSRPTGYTKIEQSDASFFSKNKTVILIAGLIFSVFMIFNNR